MGSHTTVDIIKTVAPIALSALMSSAQALAGGSNVQRAMSDAFIRAANAVAGKRTAVRVALDDPTPSGQIFSDLTEAGANLWQNQFDYYYQGNASMCLSGNKTVRASNSGSDLVIYDNTQGQMPDITGYITKVFKDTALSDQAQIELVNNLTGIIQDRWTEESLAWTPLTKTYASLPFSNGMNVDMLLYTACATDNSGSGTLAGLAFYMFTYYQTPSS